MFDELKALARHGFLNLTEILRSERAVKVARRRAAVRHDVEAADGCRLR